MMILCSPQSSPYKGVSQFKDFSVLVSICLGPSVLSQQKRLTGPHHAQWSKESEKQEEEEEGKEELVKEAWPVI